MAIQRLSSGGESGDTTRAGLSSLRKALSRARPDDLLCRASLRVR